MVNLIIGKIMSKVILVVEDEPRNLKLIRDLLHVTGYETLEATDGRQGVELARAHKPDLILMDISMPIMDGIEATKALKADAETKNIPIIALTSHAMKGDEDKIRAAGCDGYLTKPIDTREFLKMVVSYLTE
jgi:two-component system, cell cycle response regulator DivK